jgi:hypothetical protein
VSVLVEDTAESIASSDVEVGESVWFGDRLGERAQGCRRSERPVGSVLVVEGFVLAQRVQEVVLVHDQPQLEFSLAKRTDATGVSLRCASASTSSYSGCTVTMRSSK